MQASRPLLLGIVLTALLAAAAPEAAGLADGELRVSASAGSDGHLSAEAEGVAVEADAQETVEAGGDLLASADPTTATQDFSSGGSDGPAVDRGDGIRRSAAGPAAEAAGAASLAVLAGYLLTKLEGAAWLRRTAAFGIAPLYSRIDRSEILDNETRREMYEVVQDEPGVSMQDVTDEVGCGWGTVVYHLERLEEADLVVSRKDAGRRRFFAAGDVPAEDKDAVGVLRQDTPRRIAAHLVREPGAHQSDLCEALDIAASTASKHLTRLEEAGLVERERDWRKVHYFPADGLAERLELLEEAATASRGTGSASPAAAA